MVEGSVGLPDQAMSNAGVLEPLRKLDEVALAGDGKDDGVCVGWEFAKAS